MGTHVFGIMLSKATDITELSYALERDAGICFTDYALKVTLTTYKFYAKKKCVIMLTHKLSQKLRISLNYLDMHCKEMQEYVLLIMLSKTPCLLKFYAKKKCLHTNSLKSYGYHSSFLIKRNIRTYLRTNHLKGYPRSLKPQLIYSCRYSAQN